MKLELSNDRADYDSCGVCSGGRLVTWETSAARAQDWLQMF